jgi:serine/threonine protein kinase
MTEKSKEFRANKKIIFKVLNRKRNLEHSPNNNKFKKKAKNLFILEKPRNIINTENQNLNEINDNNPKLLEKNKLTKQINIQQNENIAPNPPIKNIKMEFGDYICYNNYTIGNGSFGEVLYGKQKSTHKEVAIKILKEDMSKESIKKEMIYTEKLKGNPGFPTLYYTGMHDKNNIIVESLLGPSLDKLFKFCQKKFPLKTVCLIGIEMVKRLETMHNLGLLHRDLKPNNLTWGNYNSSYNKTIPQYFNNNDKLDINTIYLIDFGLSCYYWDNIYTRKHYKIQTECSFVGTLRYASLNSHNGIKQSRRDDLESMLYILIYYLKGQLPWQEVKAKKKEERYKIIREKKSEISVDILCEDIPTEFAELLKYVKSLEFEDSPSYTQFYKTFYNLINRLNFEQCQEKNYNYIWEKKLVDGLENYEKNNDDKLIKEAEELFKGYPINLKEYINYIITNNKLLNEFNKKRESFHSGDTTEFSESIKSINLIPK